MDAESRRIRPDVATFRLDDEVMPTRLAWAGAAVGLLGSNEHGPHSQTVVLGVIHLPADCEPHLLGSDILTLHG